MPLPVLAVRMTKSPGHIIVSPITIIDTVGDGFTVIWRLVLHPADVVYVVTTVPDAKPVITPVDIPIEAMAGLSNDHVPPDGELESETVCPVHTDKGPIIGVGKLLIVCVRTAVHPVATRR